MQGSLTQIGLFDVPYQSHSETSKAAAVAIRPKVKGLRKAVLDFIISRKEYGATDEEVQDGILMGGSTERPRRTELVASGDVVASRMKRATNSGKLATVWIGRGFAN